MKMTVRPSARMASMITSGGILMVCGYTVYFISTSPAIREVGHLIGRGAIFSVFFVTTLIPAILKLIDLFIVTTPKQRMEEEKKKLEEKKEKLREHRKERHGAAAEAKERTAAGDEAQDAAGTQAQDAAGMQVQEPDRREAQTGAESTEGEEGTQDES